jgi:hypothetical protein
VYCSGTLGGVLRTQQWSNANGLRGKKAEEKSTGDAWLRARQIIPNNHRTCQVHAKSAPIRTGPHRWLWLDLAWARQVSIRDRAGIFRHKLHPLCCACAWASCQRPSALFEPLLQKTEWLNGAGAGSRRITYEIQDALDGGRWCAFRWAELDSTLPSPLYTLEDLQIRLGRTAVASSRQQQPSYGSPHERTGARQTRHQTYSLIPTLPHSHTPTLPRSPPHPYTHNALGGKSGSVA